MLFAAALLAVVLAGSSAARAESAEDFFRGKQISLIIGYNPGGTYDLYSRLAASILPRYIPGNPTIIPKNMPGVAGVKAANFLYSQAPKDGLTIGMIGQQLALTQALRDPSVEYDMRAFHWLGRFTPIVEVTVIWHTSPVKTLADAMTRETTLAGTKFKIIKGYPGTTGSILAMGRGETEGAHATLENLLFGKADWLRDKKISVIVQYAQARHPAFPDVPAMVEFGKTAEDKQVLALFGSTADIGRALMTPPGIPADRLTVLRRAFATMVADPAFKAELENRHMEFGPMSGEDLQTMIKTTLDIPPAVAARAIALARE